MTSIGESGILECDTCGWPWVIDDDSCDECLEKAARRADEIFPDAVSFFDAVRQEDCFAHAITRDDLSEFVDIQCGDLNVELYVDGDRVRFSAPPAYYVRELKEDVYVLLPLLRSVLTAARVPIPSPSISVDASFWTVMEALAAVYLYLLINRAPM